MSSVIKRRRINANVPLLPIKPGELICMEAIDSSIARIPASFLMKGPAPRDPQPQSARLANSFIRQNHGIFSSFGISISQEYDGNSVNLILKTGTKIGAIPLLSPTTGRPDFGLVIKPRFNWSGIGSMLGKMGWKVIPSILKLPLLPLSDRKIPPWVLSTTVLMRVKALLDSLERRFEFVEADLKAPRGSVNWAKYAVSRISSARFLDVPCRYPDLRDDREIKAAIHYTLLKQLTSLESQRNAGIFVFQLISICQALLERVCNVSAKVPTSMAFSSFYRGSFRTDVFRDGLQAMEWTVDDRGLAGLGDLKGLPWIMPMDEFFEAWVETVVEKLAQRIGGILRVGRKRETVTPLKWDPPYTGSQKYLLPDLVLERLSSRGDEVETIIFDAKYKSHWEDLNIDQWGNLHDDIREQHRADLLQVLAYSTSYNTNRIVSCLIYPCQMKTWESLKKRGLLFHYASINSDIRNVNLIITAIPMESRIDEAIYTLLKALQGDSI